MALLSSFDGQDFNFRFSSITLTRVWVNGTYLSPSVVALNPQTVMSGPLSVGPPRLLTGLTPQSAAQCVSTVGLFGGLAALVGVNLKGRGVPTDEVSTDWRG